MFQIEAYRGAICPLGQCPLRVKNGKTQQEQMFSALRPTADIVSEAVRIRGEAAFHNRTLCELRL